MHYFARYEAHANSLKLEREKLRPTCDGKAQFYMENAYSWQASQFISEAFDTLARCRQTLKFTYCFAFYLEATTTKSIFEDNQVRGVLALVLP